MNKVLKSRPEYDEALSTLERLLDLDPVPGTAASEHLELLTLLVRDYESRQFSFSAADPVEAIKFRMEQQNLSPRDLIPFLGSRSKVSEVLAGKRPLTLAMIRALNSGLGIPASALIQGQEQEDESDVDWDRFPMKQMIAFGWLSPSQGQVRAEDVLRPFFAQPGILKPQAVLYRSSRHVRSARPADDYALAAWSARVLAKACVASPVSPYHPGALDQDSLLRLVRLSVAESGPLQAKDFLGERGVRLVVERHLPHTYLDGAAIMTDELGPVIGLTLRYDRIDNFWFTLMHELAHLVLHLGNKNDVLYFYDDLDIAAEDDARERAADQLAGETLIPHDVWEKSPASHLRSPQAAEYLAQQLGIHPAIVAGRMQHEFKAFQLLRNLVGHGQVRKLFPEVTWE